MPLLSDKTHNTDSLKLRAPSKDSSMASVSYESRYLRFRLFKPQILRETHHTPPPSVQIELNLSIGCTFVRHDRRTGQLIGNRDHPSIAQETLRFDLDVLKNGDQAHQILARALARLGVNPTSETSANLVRRIVRQGLKMGNQMPKGEGKVLSLRAELWAIILEYVNNEEDSINRVLSESALEFETSNYGMIPAEESSVEKMLTKVSVETGEENCVICLEELPIGSEASRLPCSHSFHGDCIQKWMKLSHYCPMCRFEMPS